MGVERSEAPGPFNWGVFTPAPVESDVEQTLVATASAALAALGFDSGAAHVEVILTEAGPRVVEVAACPGGGHLPEDLIRLAYGVDTLADALRMAVGDAPRERRTHRRGAALFWIPTHSGVVTEIRGAEEARAVPGVEKVVMVARPGDVMGHVVDCPTRDRVGYVLASGEEVGSAVDAAKRARDLCQVVTRSGIERP